MEALAAAAIATLTPYLVAGGKKAAETYGEHMAKGTIALWGKVRDWLSEDVKSAPILRDYERDPTTYTVSVEKALAEKLAVRPDLQAELQTLMDGFGSRVVVRQRIEELAGSLVGVNVGIVRRKLDAYVDQQATTVARGATMTGAVIRER